MTTEVARPYGSDSDVLRGLCGGDLFLPGDEGYDQARTTWALAVDLQPAAVAFPRSAEDVAQLVRRAATAGLRVAPIGTGHSSQSFGDLSRTVLVRMSKLKSVRIDPARRVARAEAGVVWDDVVQPAARYGLAALHGSSPDAGVVGHSLGGGLSWYGRAHGLAVNQVVAVELVGADGTPRQVDARHEPELFWALRGGGGGNFGVVTALEFRLFPITDAYAGMLTWEWSQAERVLSRYLDWAPGASDQVTTAYRHVQLAGVPGLPERLRDRSLIIVDGAVLGDDATAERILAPLRELAPELDTFGRVAAPELLRIHLNPEGPTAVAGKATLVGELPAAAADRLLEVCGPDSSTGLMMPLELRQLGGAAGRPHPDAGALGHFDGAYQVISGGWMVSDRAESTMADAARVIEAIRPWANGREYLNFQGDPVDTAAGFTAEAWSSLRRIRAAVDPAGLFQANHEIN